MTIPINIGGTIRINVVIKITTAPKAYDGFGTFEVGETRLKDAEARMVAIREEHLIWQTSRYASGWFPVVDSQWVDQDTVEEILYRKLIGAPEE